MIKKPDSAYYAERLAAELKAVETATNEAVRSAHQELADHYAELLRVAAVSPMVQPASDAA